MSENYISPIPAFTISHASAKSSFTVLGSIYNGHKYKSRLEVNSTTL